MGWVLGELWVGAQAGRGVMPPGRNGIFIPVQALGDVRWPRGDKLAPGLGRLLVQQPWWGIQRGWRAPPQGSGTLTDAGERELVQTPQLSRPNPVFCWQTGIMAITSNKINLVFTPKLLQGLW